MSVFVQVIGVSFPVYEYTSSEGFRRFAGFRAHLYQ